MVARCRSSSRATRPTRSTDPGAAVLEVLKVTAKSGRQFFSKRHDVIDMLERVPDWRKLERVHMSPEAFAFLERTDPDAKVFK